MSREISVGTFRADFNRLASMVDDEWQARRPDEEAPGGYASSKEFQKFKSDMSGLKDRHLNELDKKFREGKDISQAEIDTLRNLEELMYRAERDPSHSSFQKGLEKIKNGENPFRPGRLDSQRFQDYMDLRHKNADNDSLGSIKFTMN